MGISSQIDPVLKAIFHHFAGRTFEPQLLPSTCLNRSKTSDCRDTSEERFFGLNQIKTSPLGTGWRIRGGKGCCLKVCLRLQTCGGTCTGGLVLISTWARCLRAAASSRVGSAGCCARAGGKGWAFVMAEDLTASVAVILQELKQKNCQLEEISCYP